MYGSICFQKIYDANKQHNDAKNTPEALPAIFGDTGCIIK